MTGDFFQDATDSLEQSGMGYIIIAAPFGDPRCHQAANVPSREHLEWFKRRFQDLCDKLEKKYEG